MRGVREGGVEGRSLGWSRLSRTLFGRDSAPVEHERTEDFGGGREGAQIEPFVGGVSVATGRAVAPGGNADEVAAIRALLPPPSFNTYCCFNKTTLLTFLTDGLKALVLGLAIGGPLLAGILAFFTYAGVYAWVYCWGATTLFTLALQWLAPTWIMPLFNTFTPLADGELRQAIFAYAHAARFPVDDVFVMDGSRRSSKSNAFFTGFGKHKRIALFDTLVAQHTPPELVAVLAHEIGHYKKKHIVQNMIISLVHTAVVFWLLSVFLSHPGLFQAFYVTQPSVYAGLIFFGLLYTPVELLLSVLMHIMSRQHEYEADRFATDTLDNTTALTAALKKLSANNLSNLTPHPFYVFLHYSHPPMLERVRAIQRSTAYAG